MVDRKYLVKYYPPGKNKFNADAQHAGPFSSQETAERFATALATATPLGGLVIFSIVDNDDNDGNRD